MAERTPQQQHRHDVTMGIVLPMLGGLLGLAVLVGLAIALLNAVQFSILADTLTIFFILVPYVVMCLIPTLLLMAAALGLWALHGNIARPLARFARKATISLQKAQRQIPRAGRPLLGFQSRAAYVERLISGRRKQV